MRNGVLGALLVTGALVATTGCQRLNFSKTFSLARQDIKDLTFDAPAYEQRVKVTVTPTSGGVMAYLVKASDARAVERYLGGSDRDPPPSLILGQGGSKTATDSYSFDATVPAKTEYTLLLKTGMKATDVKVTVVGR